MANDRFHPYDRGLYSRNFLNCYQRQSMVMLAERVPGAYRLLYRCLVGTDEILRQTVREQQPKYAFESGLLASEDLALIGVVREDTLFDSYADARETLLDLVERQGYAILVGDVFYWPHCPEYRDRHLRHTIVLTGYDRRERRWSLIDDNPASLLCAYEHAEQVIADSFDNGELRQVRSYTVGGHDPAKAAAGTRDAFSRLLADHQDSRELLTGVGELLDCRWISPARAISSLYDALCLYQGSRTGLLDYVRQDICDPADGGAEGLLEDVLRQAAGMQNELLLGKVTGLVDAVRLAAAGRALGEADERLVERLREVAGPGRGPVLPA